MKTKNYIIIIVLFFVCHTSTAQIPLDTIFISNKKSVESTEKNRYYYFPNLQAYFDTQKELYIYKQNGNWITAKSIPPSYRGYCLRNGHYVLVNGYTGDEPYVLFDKHKKTYPADYSTKRKARVNTSTE